MTTFAELGINPAILKALTSLGFTTPTPVQAQVIPLMLTHGEDLISLAQTGTGKTAAFGIPLIQQINPANRQSQALILCPTRELCMQVSRDLQALARYLVDIRIMALYGGTPLAPQIKALSRGVQIIIATPGRLHDLLKRGKANLSTLQHVVFDEADEMLQMGFQDELNAILAHTPKDKNTLLFSATMAREVRAIAGRYMTNPRELTIGTQNAGADHVQHDYYVIQPAQRYLALKRLMDHALDNYAIVFCRTRRDTNDIAAKLRGDGYNADALHGELSQDQRDQVMGKFRRKQLQILVATDVAARGLDVNDLTHVINYNLPDDPAAYTHRSGRTGRAGRPGISLLLIEPRELFKIKIIERKIHKKFNKCLLPSGEEVCKKQLTRLVAEVSTAEIDHQQLTPLYDDIASQLAHLDRDELIKKFVSLEFQQLLASYKNAPDLNVSRAAAKRHRKKNRQDNFTKKARPGKTRFTRFHLNVGRRDGILPQGILGKINKASGRERIQVGKIEIMRNTALLEAESRFTAQILAAFTESTINGKAIAIAVARDHRTPPLKHKTRKKRAA